MQNLVEKLTNNLVVAAFVPSIVFCTAIILVFQSQMPTTILSGIVDIYQEIGLFVIFVAFTISLFLVYLRELIFEFYKGSYFPKSFAWFEKKRAQRKIEKIEELRTKFRESNQLDSPSQQQMILIRKELYGLVSTHQ